VAALVPGVENVSWLPCWTHSGGRF